MKCEPSKILQKSWKKFLDAVWQYWRYLEVSPDQGGHFLSLECLIWSPPKIFYSTNLKDIESMRFCQNILSPFWASFFKNLNFFHFSRHIIWLVCRTVTIFLLAQRYKVCKLFRYLEHARKVRRNVSRGFWKKILLKKNEVLSEWFPMTFSVFFHLYCSVQARFWFEKRQEILFHKLIR